MSSARPADSFASDVATLTAIVVVPTPPLAPTNANTAPAAAIVRCPRRRFTAALNSACASGSAMHSFTPARIASSISAGSIVDAIRITLIEGCFRFSSGSVDGSRCWPRTSIRTMSGWAPSACSRELRSEIHVVDET